MKPAKALKISDISLGEGDKPDPGVNVLILYTCRLNRGDILHENLDRSNPTIIRFGARDTCVALEHGVIGMRPGGVRHISSPSHLNHVEYQIFPDLSECAVLHYEIKLIGYQGRWKL